ncbi:Sucrose symporter plant [Penicillium coprophilum]|uniref:Sucrose symporter plant n=1 Tax=Penicillium coprophilum TaxID=36646 RepID=UPI00238597CA|nr:Sucrose symporter plant [Penicillium coprophilum]KAJ5153858.1 Sucrose symporter plant [Penicillium coprophilum]
MVYYVPIWAIRGLRAVRSGIDSLPIILSNVAGIILCGGSTTRLGYVVPFFIMSSIIMSIGAGLITTFTVDVSQATWIAYLFLYGLGVGCGFQQGAVASQTAFPLSKVSIGTAIVMFIQTLGGALFVAVVQKVLTKELILNLSSANVANGGATSVRSIFGDSILPEVLVAYNDALVRSFNLLSS